MPLKLGKNMGQPKLSWYLLLGLTSKQSTELDQKAILIFFLLNKAKYTYMIIQAIPNSLKWYSTALVIDSMGWQWKTEIAGITLTVGATWAKMNAFITFS